MAGIEYDGIWGINPYSYAEFNRGIQRLADAAGKGAKEAMVPQARLFCADLAFHTKPIGKTAADGKSHQEEIKKRINSVYLTVGAAVNIIKRKSEPGAVVFRKMLRKGNYTEARYIMNEFLPGNWSVGTFDGGKLHRDQRFSKKVRIRMVVIDKASLTAYTKRTVKLSGFAKAGFAAAARQLGGVRGIPGFVTRQKAQGRGKVSGDKKTLKIEIFNDVKHIEFALDYAGEGRALAHRSRQITKDLNQRATRKFKKASKSLK